MSKLVLNLISKHYDALSAVQDVTLEIQSGEFFSFLGPSGCGKTTLLRMIAGLEAPSSGRILIDGVDVTSSSPQQRDTVMVFQNYALFPHMTVSGNVAFGLETRKMSRSEIRQRVTESLSLVQLERKIDSHIQDLSGGEQQRVALARAIAVRPKILLMDEPLSNLDITLRAETRSEIKRLQQATGITTVYVTHDQGEALGLSDRLAVLQHGRVVQVGVPVELYERPRHVFVASFLGNANILSAKVQEVDSGLGRVEVNNEIQFSAEIPNRVGPGEEVFVAVRPEHIRLVSVNGSYDFKATVEAMEFQGITTEYRIRSGNQELRAIADSKQQNSIKVRDDVGVKIGPEKCFVYPASEK